eukprot:scaffold732_cov60-Phaeocystis_antarctica.AAC.21
MNAVLFGLQHEVLETTGLGEQPCHLPEPDDGYSEWDNDVSHLLGVDETGDAPERPARPTGTAKVAAISSLFSRISEQAPASARYQQVAHPRRPKPPTAPAIRANVRPEPSGGAPVAHRVWADRHAGRTAAQAASGARLGLPGM